MRCRVAAACVTLLLSAAGRAQALDDFGSLASWKASGSEGVSATLAAAPGPHGGALRLDFDFRGHAGWAVARREAALELPANYEIRLWARFSGPPNDLEVKLVDGSGANVWWRRYAAGSADSPGAQWRELRIPKRRLEFAWGPVGGGEPRAIAALELAVVARAGGSGKLEIAGFEMRTLGPPPPWPPRLVATASVEPAAAALAVDGDPHTAWRVAAARAELDLDLGVRYDLGGLVIDWQGDDFASDYVVEAQENDGGAWSALRTVHGGNGGRDWLALPETAARRLRLRLERSASGRGFAIAEVAVRPLEFSATRNAFLAAVAADLPRGAFPRAMVGEQSYWTIVAGDGDGLQALLSEDGAVEPWAGGPSVEPFLRVDGRLWSWAEVRATQSLAADRLPIPTVRWSGPPIELEITAFADGPPPQVRARYRLSNRGTAQHQVELVLAVRPLQVDPPTQFLNRPGGAAEVERIEPDGETVRIAPHGGLRPAPWPTALGATSFDGGEVGELLSRGALPTASAAVDPQRLASGALVYAFHLAPGETRSIAWSAALSGGAAPVPAGSFDERRWAVEAGWRQTLDGVRFRLPGDAQRLARLAATALAHVLEIRARPALRPGARSYARSWIRDGAMMSAALLRFGHDAVVREYLRWYAGYVLPSGRVPCCVDQRGGDPVAENDSDGELLFLAGEYWRFTGDVATLRAVWPRLRAAAEHIDRLRGERRTAEYAAPSKRAFFGLLPESISHEGYSAHPVHSFWDDFWALRGLKDAVEVAGALGEPQVAARWAQVRDEFAADLLAALERTIRERGIDYLPGSVELADFDPTSSTVALDPAGEEARLPQSALRRTFTRYAAEAKARFDGGRPYDYTPYELRNVGALVRLGERGAALELLGRFVYDLRPAGWNQWPEVVWSDLRQPRFLGDLPHAWVESDFLRAFTDLFAYVRESDHSLVLAAGVPTAWLRSAEGVGVEGLRTPYGRLGFSAREANGVLRLRIGGGLRVPPGGVVLALPRGGAPTQATVCGRRLSLQSDEPLRLRSLPCEVVFVPGVDR